MKKYIITILYVLILSISGIVYGQTTQPVTGEYTVLSPLPGTTKSCVGTECTADINSYLSGFLNLTITIGAVLAMIYIGIYGFQYAISDSAPKKSEYKDKIWEIFQGLLLIISAYTIIYTINPKFVEISLEITSPKSKAFAPATTSGGSTTGGAIGTSRPGIPMTSGEIMASDLIRSSLLQANITTYAGPCVSGQTRGCVNLNGVLPTTQLDLIELRKFCTNNCMTITGGTEGGHSTTGSHPQGRGIDLRPNSELNQVLRVTNPTEGTKLRVNLSNGRSVMFTYETAGGNDQGTSTGDHWHLDFN